MKFYIFFHFKYYCIIKYFILNNNPSFFILINSHNINFVKIGNTPLITFVIPQNPKLSSTITNYNKQKNIYTLYDIIKHTKFQL